MTKIFCLLTLTALLHSCKSITIAKHIRAYDNEQFIYKFQTDSLGKLYYYGDTLTCRMLVRKGVLGKMNNKNFDVFYFEKPVSANSTYDSNPFDRLTFCFDKGNLYIGHDLSRGLNPMFGNKMVLLMPSKIRKGEVFTFKGSDYKFELIFLGFESLKWHNLGFQNCLKFSVNIGYSKKTHYVWFSQKWGIIKWIMPNGNEGVLYE
jgi:hypothetical protein